MLVLFGYRHYEAQVSCDKFFFGFFTLAAAFLDFLCQVYLLINCDKRSPTNLYQVLVQSLAGAIGDAFLNL